MCCCWSSVEEVDRKNAMRMMSGSCLVTTNGQDRMGHVRRECCSIPNCYCEGLAAEHHQAWRW